MEKTKIIMGIIIFIVLWVEACCSFMEGCDVIAVLRYVVTHVITANTGKASPTNGRVMPPIEKPFIRPFSNI